jgi:hypothetical protein
MAQHPVDLEDSIPFRLARIRSVVAARGGNRIEAVRAPEFQNFKNRNPWDKWSDFPRWDKRGR